MLRLPLDPLYLRLCVSALFFPYAYWLISLILGVSRFCPGRIHNGRVYGSRRNVPCVWLCFRHIYRLRDYSCTADRAGCFCNTRSIWYIHRLQGSRTASSIAHLLIARLFRAILSLSGRGLLARGCHFGTPHGSDHNRSGRHSCSRRWRALRPYLLARYEEDSWRNRSGCCRPIRLVHLFRAGYGRCNVRRQALCGFIIDVVPRSDDWTNWQPCSASFRLSSLPITIVVSW